MTTIILPIIIKAFYIKKEYQIKWYTISENEKNFLNHVAFFSQYFSFWLFTRLSSPANMLVWTLKRWPSRKQHNLYIIKLTWSYNNNVIVIITNNILHPTLFDTYLNKNSRFWLHLNFSRTQGARKIRTKLYVCWDLVWRASFIRF